MSLSAFALRPSGPSDTQLQVAVCFQGTLIHNATEKRRNKESWHTTKNLIRLTHRSEFTFLYFRPLTKISSHRAQIFSFSSGCIPLIKDKGRFWNPVRILQLELEQVFQLEPQQIQIDSTVHCSCFCRYSQCKSNVLTLIQSAKERDQEWLVCLGCISLSKEMNLDLVMKDWKNTKEKAIWKKNNLQRNCW